MKINKNTRISTLINADEAVIDVIASINKNFRKLKNPILRKVLAPRVTIADAAKVGGVSLEEFLDQLVAFGFEFEGDLQQDQPSNAAPKEAKSPLNKAAMDQLVVLDVRPTLDSGEDPFNIIMKTIKTLKQGETLQIINTFEPIPLIRKLESKGYDSWTERPEEGVVHTFFKYNPQKWVDDEVEKKVKKVKRNFDEVLESFGDKVRKIDVRQLEMPEPMVTILKEIESLPDDWVLYVDHKKIPQFLLPELEKRNYDILYKEIDCNHTILLIFKSE